MGRQDDQRRTVALRAFLELVQPEGREGACLFVKRRGVPLLKQRKDTRDVFMKQRRVGRTPAQQFHSGKLLRAVVNLMF